MQAEELLIEVCGIFNKKVDTIKGKSRSSEFVRIRHYYCYVAYVYLDIPLTVIGATIHRDHTSVMHGRDCIIKEIDDMNEPYMSDISTILNRLNITKKDQVYRNIAEKYDALVNEFLAEKNKMKKLQYELEQKNKDIEILEAKVRKLTPRSIFGDPIIVEKLKEEHFKI